MLEHLLKLNKTLRFSLNPNARMFLIKCYGRLQNARFNAITVSELLRKNERFYNFVMY